ncbi:MAG: bifunctional riboflavin kinase/FAD synthetase [Flavobacteriales bacterium]|nr:MAG: bifunctional riboflavin kinase/FAD synthetase [Flavobacteriales bacterium]
MTIYNNINEFSSTDNTILTIGTFDGVHLGHQKVLERLTNSAKENNLESTVLTFFPHPRTILNPNKPLKLINSVKERTELLNRSKVDNLIIHPFDKNFSELDPEKYVFEILVKKLKAKIILIGYDHKFGKNRTADITDLKIYGKKYGFKVIEIKAEEISNIAISSTKIRKAISEGNISTAKKYLGYDFSLSGKIVHGKSIGRTLGFPTANIEVKEEYKLLPKNGVYLIQSVINHNKYFGMMNIGIKPTIKESSKTIEVNFFDFEGDLYHKNIEVNIKKFIRDEIKFDSLELLKSQILKDKINCNSIIDIID